MPLAPTEGEKDAIQNDDAAWQRDELCLGIVSVEHSKMFGAREKTVTELKCFSKDHLLRGAGEKETIHLEAAWQRGELRSGMALSTAKRFARWRGL